VLLKVIWAAVCAVKKVEDGKTFPGSYSRDDGTVPEEISSEGGAGDVNFSYGSGFVCGENLDRVLGNGDAARCGAQENEKTDWK
jgi:hypothetical protein